MDQPFDPWTGTCVWINFSFSLNPLPGSCVCGDGRLSHDYNMVIWEKIKDLTDERLVRFCANGNEEALKPLYFRYRDIVFRHLYRMTTDRVTAEDLTEETFFRVWRKASLFDPEKGSFKTWLFRMATRLAINKLNKRARREKRASQVALSGFEMENPLYSPEEAACTSEARELVQKALSSLREKDRAVLSLRHLDSMGEHDVARILGIPKGTVKSRTYYAIRRLKDVLVDMGYKMGSVPQ